MIPQPESYRLLDGSYTLHRDAGMQLDDAFLPVSEGIAALLPMLHGEGDALRFDLDETLPASRYKLCCDQDGVHVAAGGAQGALYAAATLRQMYDGGALPFCEIEDAPYYSWRGQHLDVCRHFFPLETVMKLIDLLALYKMNRLHLHLSDDQGFRIESERFPLLNSVGSWRSSSAVKRGNGEEQDGERHGGYYTKDEIRRLVAYASARGVEIIPEFDFPGHSCALLAAYPALACFPREGEVITRYGIQDFSSHILCAGNEAVYELLFALIDETAALFPFPYFHIGGDEAVKTEWKKCPRCQAKIKELGLKDERALQGWFLKRLADHLESIGKRAVIWNDGLTPLLTPDAVCQYWTPPAVEGAARSCAHLKAGGQAIMSGFRYLYYDYPYAMTPLRKAFLYQPVPKKLPKEAAKSILGVESCLWTEWIADEEKLFYNLLPRLCATASLAWQGPQRRSWKAFCAALPRQYRLFDEMGLRYAKGKDRRAGILSRALTTRRFFVKDANIELKHKE